MYGPVEFINNNNNNNNNENEISNINSCDLKDTTLLFDKYKNMKYNNPFIDNNNINNNNNTSVEICNDLGDTVLRISFDNNNLEKLFKASSNNKNNNNNNNNNNDDDDNNDNKNDKNNNNNNNNNYNYNNISSAIGIQYNFELFDTSEESLLLSSKGVAAAVNAPEWIVPIGCCCCCCCYYYCCCFSNFCLLYCCFYNYCYYR